MFRKSTEDKLIDAKMHLDAGRYAEARKILKKTNHKLARAWLAKLDRVEKRKRVDMWQEDEDVYVASYRPNYQQSGERVVVYNNNTVEQNVNVRQNNYGCLGAPLWAGRIIIASMMVTYFCAGLPIALQSGDPTAVSGYIAAGIVLFLILGIVHILGFVFWWIAALFWMLIACSAVTFGISALVNPSILIR